MPYSCRALALASSLVLAAWIPCAYARTAQAALFDQYAGGDLPQSFTLPAEGPDDAPLAVDLLERLAADVEYPDGSHAITYTGSVDGRSSTFTRIGEELVIDTVEAFADDEQRGPRVRRSLGGEAGLVDHFFAAPEEDSRWVADGGKEDPDVGLRFWIFLHDSSGETNYAKFHNWYIAWWLRDMEKTVVPGVPVKVIIRKGIPGVTDIDYMSGTEAEQLWHFGRKANDYLHGIGANPTALTKTMLFIADRPSNWDGVYGTALPRMAAAMASGWGPRHIVAHEFGHTLDAVHELAETRTCVTSMKGYVIGRFACQFYTGANDERIRAYVDENLRQR